MPTPVFNPRRLRGKARYLPVSADPPPAAVADAAAMYAFRLERTRAQMRRRDIGACLLFDAVNIRYACGARNMQIFTSRNAAARYLLLPAEGAITLFEFPGCEHLAAGSIVGEVLPARAVSYVAAGGRQREQCKKWGDETDALLRAAGCGKRIGMEAASHLHACEMRRRGYEVLDAQEVMEHARAVKSPDEIACMRHSLAVTESGVARLRENIRPGMSENALWSHLHQAIIAGGGDYIETRLLSSGARTNPWFQECCEKNIGAGELIGLDTDVVGPGGYYADFSRTFYAGAGAPSARQKELYKLAYEQVRHNAALCVAGMSFRDIAARAWKIPAQYVNNRYFVVAHGVGMTGEYPYILHDMDFADAGYDGVLAPMMTLCVESYIGGDGDGEGVKLEEQLLVTDSGVEILSKFPYEEELMTREF